MKRVFRITFAACALAFAGSAFAGAADDIMIKNAYARAVPPGQPNSAAFMMMMNKSGTAHAVVNAKTDVAKMAELHTHLHENGVMKMRRIDRIDVPANGSVTLQPGGLHVMLMGLKGDLKEGGTATIELEFEDGSTKTITVPVRSVMGGMQMQQMDHNMGHGHMKH